MNQSASNPGDRIPLLITIGIFLAMLACVPLVLMLDDNIDEDRPMYRDLQRMQTYRAAHVANDGSPVEVTVSEGEVVEIGASAFETSPGVTIRVRATDKDSFCVTASNDSGEKAERCS
ncbi:hypothetical protein [Nocardioides sp. B-3]|uniref:hypothetical protein n=1 Tax=Nocardioides sp. B-3 TaxID=2895565 RepID=UPI002152D41D|nr:hypothetical protein [Nocardioides sp. B-3]UUZ59069.1 hypothetical protein LP418_24410 [Nocardioides sp. B-3]